MRAIRTEPMDASEKVSCESVEENIGTLNVPRNPRLEPVVLNLISSRGYLSFAGTGEYTEIQSESSRLNLFAARDPISPLSCVIFKRMYVRMKVPLEKAP